MTQPSDAAASLPSGAAFPSASSGPLHDAGAVPPVVVGRADPAPNRATLAAGSGDPAGGVALGRGVLEGVPKVVLHDHLDGGLRAGTLLELAGEIGHELPASDPGALAEWFVEAASAGSLERYLTTFDHTLAVMQTSAALTRVAREAVIDLAADAVVYAELRFAPELHERRGLGLQQIVDAVLAGIDEGTQEARRQGRTIVAKLLLDAMRQADRSEQIARLVIDNRTRVAGYDIAGPEKGFPVLHHMAAFELLSEASVPVTVHAGESDGLNSIWQAVVKAGARRIGHGVALVEDIAGLGLPGSPAGPWDEDGFDAKPSADGGAQGGAEFAQLGELAHWIRDWGIVLEMCPSSNVQTGAAESISAHPITALKRLGFAVTVNTDNRLMSGTSMTQEFTRLMSEAGWTLGDVRDATVNAAKGAFIHADERDGIVEEVILPAYAAAGQTPLA